MYHLTIQKNFHVSVKNKYMVKDESNDILYTAIGTVLNFKDNYTITDSHDQTIANLETSYKGNIYVSNLHMNNQTVCTLERYSKRDFKKTGILIKTNLQGVPLKVIRNKTNFSFHIIMNDKVICEINRKWFRTVNTFYIRYFGENLDKQTLLILTCIVILIDTIHFYYWQNIVEDLI